MQHRRNNKKKRKILKNRKFNYKYFDFYFQILAPVKSEMNSEEQTITKHWSLRYSCT